MAEKIEMNIRHARDLALKIFGIYYLSHVLIVAPQFCSLFMQWDKSPESVGYKVAMALSVLLPFVFWIIIAVVLTFRTSVVVALLWPSQADEPQTTTTAKPSLSFWIVLVGFFYFVGAFGGAVAEIWILTVARHMHDSFTQYRFVSELVTLVLSIVCIVKATSIETFLWKQIGKDSQQTPGGDSSTRASAGL